MDDGWPIRMRTATRGCKIRIFSSDIETWAGFQRIQVMMTDNQCLGVTLPQMLNQFSQRCLLCFRPGVFRCLSVSIQSAYVAHPDTVRVMTLAVCSGQFFRTTGFYRSVCRDYVVVTTAVPAQRTMVAVNVHRPQGTARLVGRAVHDNQRDRSHKPPPSAPPAAPVISSSMMRTMYSSTFFQFFFIRFVFK